MGLRELRASGLGAAIFSPGSWSERVDQWLKGEECTSSNAFLEGNERALPSRLNHSTAGLRAVVNIPADALLGFLEEGKYKNAAEAPVVNGFSRQPSAKRQWVDELLFPADLKQYYFGAVALGGTGVRFYGEYCLVLRRESITGQTGVFDRNSYDIALAPLGSSDPKEMQELVSYLRGIWELDLVSILKLRVLPRLKDIQFLVTAGTVSDLILHDEEFTEVHRHGSFGPADLEEVRECTEDQVLDTQIRERLSRGLLPGVEELIWSARRHFVERKLAAREISARTVVSSGRGRRWR